MYYRALNVPQHKCFHVCQVLDGAVPDWHLDTKQILSMHVNNHLDSGCILSQIRLGKFIMQLFVAAKRNDQLNLSPLRREIGNKQFSLQAYRQDAIIGFLSWCVWHFVNT